MRKKLSVYIPFIKTGIQGMMEYRMNFLCFFIGNSLYCFVMYFLWKAIFESSASDTFMGFNMIEMVFFVFISNMVAFIISSEATKTLGMEIKDGSVIMRMVKPINLDFSIMFMEIGEKLVMAIGIGVPIVMGLEIYRYIVTGVVMFNVVRLLVFLLSIVLAYFISFYMNICFGFMAFFFNNIWGMDILKNSLVHFLSGAMIPIAFMPTMLQKILNILPFASLNYTPVMIYLGKYEGIVMLQSIGLQIIWLILLYGLSKLIWRIAMQHLTVQGG